MEGLGVSGLVIGIHRVDLKVCGDWKASLRLFAVLKPDPRRLAHTEFVLGYVASEYGVNLCVRRQKHGYGSMGLRLRDGHSSARFNSSDATVDVCSAWL